MPKQVRPAGPAGLLETTGAHRQLLKLVPRLFVPRGAAIAEAKLPQVQVTIIMQLLVPLKGA